MINDEICRRDDEKGGTVGELRCGLHRKRQSESRKKQGSGLKASNTFRIFRRHGRILKIQSR